MSPAPGSPATVLLEVTAQPRECRTGSTGRHGPAWSHQSHYIAAFCHGQRYYCFHKAVHLLQSPLQYDGSPLAACTVVNAAFVSATLSVINLPAFFHTSPVSVPELLP